LFSKSPMVEFCERLGACSALCTCCAVSNRALPCRFAGLFSRSPMVEFQDDRELVLPCALYMFKHSSACRVAGLFSRSPMMPAGSQACFQGVPWWSSRMTGRPSRPVLAPALAFFARSWTTTAKACRLVSQPCQPPEVDEPACHACPCLPVICFCPLTVLWEKHHLPL